MAFVSEDVSGSECFSYVAYDKENERLAMTFRKGGSYIIENIAPIEVARWMAAGSPGGYFNHFVRGRY
ncbi:MAG: KTSC domain-containing protein [Bradyrhizobiaceae bacterium]|nr:KTSC domain-containing protein [Bradyrhizobiaceae bacterium]